MNIIIFIIANIAVFISSFIFSLRLKINFIVDKLLSIFILGISQIILTELILGAILKRLYSNELLILNIIILIISAVVNRKYLSEIRFKRIQFGSWRNIFSWLVNNILLVLVGVIVFVQICYIIFIGLNFPPFAWDELWYHLTAVGSWYQEGKIFNLPVPSICSNPQLISAMSVGELAYHLSVCGFWYNVYPMNSELISLWNIIFLKNDVIVDLVQLPFAIMGMAAVYAIARKIGIGIRASLLSGLMFFMTPIIIIQSRTSYVDITFSVLTLIAINFLIGFCCNVNKSYTLMMFITLGLALGTKSTGIVLIGILFIVFLIISYFKEGREKFIKNFLKNSIILFVIVSILGGYWYFKNIYYYGNPIYPFQVKVFNTEVFKGLGSVNDLIMQHNLPKEYRNIPNIEKIFNSWLEKDSIYTCDMRKAGFGPLWFILELPCIILYIYITIKHRDKKMAVIFLTFLLLFLTIPSNWWTRYTLFIVGFGAVSVGLLMQNANKYFKLLLNTYIIILCMVVFLTTRYDICKPSTGIGQALKIPIEQRTIGAVLYSDYLWIDGLYNGARIGVMPMTFIYPLFGDDFRNKVYIVDGLTEQEWLDNVNNSKVEYITFLKDYLNYGQWVKNNSGKFEQVYDGHSLMVYKVNK